VCDSFRPTPWRPTLEESVLPLSLVYVYISIGYMDLTTANSVNETFCPNFLIASVTFCRSLSLNTVKHTEQCASLVALMAVGKVSASDRAVST